MKLRLVSDVHSEFFGEDEIAAVATGRILPPLPDDAETTLLLAGDIGAASRAECLVNFIDAVAPRFKHVLYIPGNHEYYHGDIARTPEKIKKMLAHHANLAFAAAHYFAPDMEMSIHMHTLWTDFDKENRISMMQAQQRMNDYRLILIGGDFLLPHHTLELHKGHLSLLEQYLAPGDLVMTHHSPCLRSIPEEYLTDRVNGAYHSDLTELIAKKKPKLWVHGHTHTACDYVEGDTRIVCNPHGYGNQYKKNGYNPKLVIEI